MTWRRALVGIGLLGVLYHRFLRGPVLTWGATEEEASARLPGDELLEDADGVATRAIDIEAPPSAVWPWLAQMGPAPRGGAYTYDWIENLLGLDMHSVDEVLPAHEYRFAGLEQRVRQLRAHHEVRLEELARHVAENPGATTYELATLMTWLRPWDQIGEMRRAAVGETLAHLAVLLRRGRVLRLDGDVDHWRGVPLS